MAAAVLSQAEIGRRRRVLCGLTLVAVILIGWVYRTTFVSIVEKWVTDAAFSHGWLVLPISLWLVWRDRARLQSVAWGPSWLGVLLLVGCVGTWVLARGSGVLVLEQFSAVGMLVAIVPAILGVPAMRVLLFPLVFVFFSVPFGRALVPVLMEATADVAVWMLSVTGVPVFRSHMYLHIPEGTFEVAKACSGLNYFVAGIVLGVLYAYLTYKGWRKRLLCVAGFIVIPVIANGMRVYFTILVSHWTDMRFGPGTEHVTFGRIFFVVLMLLMFWVGRRWADPEPPAAEAAGAGGLCASATRWEGWLPVALAYSSVLAGPLLFDSAMAAARAHLNNPASLVRLPPATSEWAGPEEGEGRWRPLYLGGLVERQAVYRASPGGEVDVFVAVYGLGNTQGSEMIRFDNVISSVEGTSLTVERSRVQRLPSGVQFSFRETVVEDGESQRLVWYWYVVGTRPLSSPFAVKAYEAIALLTRYTDTERVIVLSTPIDAGAPERLGAFLAAYAGCAGRGFQSADCGG